MMLKSILTICLWVIVFLSGGTQGWSGEDLEDHFIDPDFDTSKTVFIDVKDASLINVLKIISKQTGLSFIAEHDVEDRKITLYLNKVPLNQALPMVLDANDLSYEIQQDTNIFVIKQKFLTAKKTITKVYPLKYASVSSSKLNTTIANSGGSGGKAGAGGLEEVIQDSLSKAGKVVEDPRTNSLIITDVPDQFTIIDNTIAKLDVPIPQILIEVEMVDVSKGTADQLGITYGTNPLSFEGGGTKSTNFPFGPTAAGSSSSSSSSSTSSTSSGSTTTGWSASGMTAQLNLLANSTDARTLARPRILTLNNQTAQIEISLDQAISLDQTINGTSGGLNTQTTTPERATTGVTLKVTPQADLITREVTMAVSPKVIDVIPSVVQPNTSGAATVYDTETRGSDSILKLKDGQTMVIGGLMHNQESKTVNKVPFLGDLPIVGAAFRSMIKSTTERELVIFLTPHIIDNLDQSALKEGNSIISDEKVLNTQDISDRTKEIDDSLNNFDSK